MTTSAEYDPGNPVNKYRTRVLQGELSQHLLAWDIIGVTDAPEADDEYDCMISPLMHRLYDGASEEQLREWIDREVDEHFGLGSNGFSKQANDGLARTLVAWWQERTDPDQTA